MRYSVPDRLAWYVDEEADDGLVVFLMRLPDGVPVALDGTGALIWVAAMEGEDVAGIVAEGTGEPRERVEPEVVAYLDGLVADGLLTRAAEG